MSEHVAVIIPSLEGAVDDLMASIQGQTLKPAEVEVVVGVRPTGRARNVGARRTSADLLVFVDDDAVLGASTTLSALVAPLVEDPTIGVTGASKLLPPGASAFERLVARQVPRIEHPIVSEPLESNPPVGRHGYTELSATCCAMRRTVFDEARGFHEELERGEDSEFFYRVRRLGYRLLLVPATWVYHPAPATIRALLRKHFWYGVGYAQEVQLDPARAGGRYLASPAHAAAYLVLRTLGVVPHVFFPYSHAARSRLGFKPLRAVASYAAALGYVYGWYRRRLPHALHESPL